MDKEFVVGLVQDRGSKRSLQKQVGPSEIGGCRRKVWHRLQGTPVVNTDTLLMAAWMGTAIHAAIEKRMKRLDPFESRYLRERRVEFDGLVGHVDCYDMVEREVIDWKTTTKRGLADFPSEQQRWQVQVYGYLLANTGFPVATVTLVGIPRDGNETHIKVHSEPYSENVAREALAWLDAITGWQDEEPPDPEKPARFCRDYCQYYDPEGEVGCPSKSR